MEEENEFFEKKYENAGELDMVIEELENKQPDKRTKEYRIWRNKINHLYSLYNTEVKHKIYKLL